jgi:hypothetical protein
MFVGVGITALIILVGLGIVVVLPRIASHAANTPVNPNCTLIVPAQPLTAQGLATPYQLTATNPADGACDEANADQGAFVQGVIYNTTTGKFSVYSPLVVNQGSQPAVVPTAPTLTTNDVVGIWFGFNGTNLTLKGAQKTALQQGKCVNGQNQSVFGQFAYCNAPAFFAAANKGIASGLVTVPALGMAKDGMTCPTTRDFSVVDQDQSDNVQTQYLVNGNGQTAQLTAANQANLQNATVLGNPSDNALLTTFINPALGCQDWQAPDIANNNAMVSALPLDELQAAMFQKAPIALVPVTDPMTLNNNNASLTKANLYRQGVDQTQAGSANAANGTTYCQNLLNTGLPRIQLDMPLTINATTPAADMANSLYTFLASRFMMSYTNLNCQNLLHIPNPVTVQTDGNGVAISATVNSQQGNGNGGVLQTASGTATVKLNKNTGTATLSTKITYPNHANQRVNVNMVTNSCTGTAVFTKGVNANNNSMINLNTTIRSQTLRNVQTLPSNWFMTITDPTQSGTPIVACGSMAVQGTTGNITLGTVSTGMSCVTPTPTMTTTTTPVATATTTTTTTPVATGTVTTTSTPVVTGTMTATPTPAATTTVTTTTTTTPTVTPTPVCSPTGSVSMTPTPVTNPTPPASAGQSTSKNNPYRGKHRKW